MNEADRIFNKKFVKYIKSPPHLINTPVKTLNIDVDKLKITVKPDRKSESSGVL